MKNGLIVWNVILTIALGILLFLQFGGKPASKKTGSALHVDSTKHAAGPIAYFEMDSIEAHYEMVKDVQTETQQKEKEYTNGLAGLDQTYRKKIQEYQQKGSSMTQVEYEKAQTDLKQLEEVLKNKKQGLDQQYQDFVTRRNLALKKKIEEYIAEYNKSHNYSYIVVYEPGLFYYKDSVYNITSEVIKGLNDSYVSEKK